ncbi:MAG: magnesium/cobalt transporter CorA [Candidatus Omnitrophica bacterium]|nr:magnesium/cobalt transporter CorA [Candidatus Omnitrophota bacterium]
MYETFLYHPERGLKTELTPEEMSQAVQDPSSLLWLDINDIDDSTIDLLTSIFNLHPLTTEDFIMPNARTKAEKFKDYLFLVIFALQNHNNGKHEKAKTIELDCCLGKNFLVTFHSDPITPLSASKERVRKQSPIIMHGADMLLYSIIDSCVDSYFPIINEFDNLVDDMSDELFKDPTQDTLKKIYTLKNDVMHLKRTIGPQADVINLVARGDFEFISPANLIYFRNIYDNLVRLNDVVGTSRDIITGAMEAYVSIVSNRLNEIMKTLTVIATMMMPLTLVASIYGMNFKHMPELESVYGYPAVIGLMAITMAAMLIYFKRKKWL